MNTEEITDETPGEKTTLGDRMKAYETQYRQFLPRDRPFVVRLDGRCFSKLTSGLHRPYDAVFAEIMYLVASDLLVEFTPRTVYTQSDEISLLFYPKLDDDGQLVVNSEPVFGGRIDKIVSVMAAYATARFHYHVHVRVQPDHRGAAKLLSGQACFDGRVFAVDDALEVAAYIVWRCGHDCVRNSISNLAHQHLSTKQTHGKNTLQLREMLTRLPQPITWDNMAPEYRYGVFLKREKITKTDDEGRPYTRTRPARFTYHCTKGEKIVEFLQAVYWPSGRSPADDGNGQVHEEGNGDHHHADAKHTYHGGSVADESTANDQAKAK